MIVKKNNVGKSTVSTISFALLRLQEEPGLAWNVLEDMSFREGYKQMGISNLDLKKALSESYKLRETSQKLMEIESHDFIEKLRQISRICPLVRSIFSEADRQSVSIELIEGGLINGVKQHPTISVGADFVVPVSFFGTDGVFVDPVTGNQRPKKHCCSVCEHVYSTYTVQSELEKEKLDLTSVRNIEDSTEELLNTCSPSVAVYRREFNKVIPHSMLPSYGFYRMFIDNLGLIGFLYDENRRIYPFLQEKLLENKDKLQVLYSPDNVNAMYLWFENNPRKLPYRNRKDFAYALGKIKQVRQVQYQEAIDGKDPMEIVISMSKKQIVQKGLWYLEHVEYKMPNLSKFQAEGWLDWIRSFWAPIESTVAVSSATCYDYLMRFLNAAYEKFGNVPKLVKESIGAFLDTVCGWVWKVLKNYVLDSSSWEKINFVLEILGKLFVITTIGSYSWSACKFFSKLLFPDMTKKTVRSFKAGYQAEGLDLPMVSAVSLLCSVFGFSGANLRQFKDMCATINTAVGAGKNISTVLTATLLLLPSAITTALANKGLIVDPEIVSRDYDSWRIRAQGLLSCSQIARVITEPSYLIELRRCMREAHVMLTKNQLPGPSRTVMIGLWTRLHSMTITLSQLESQRGARNFPYSLHLSGPPGVGKTQLTSLLMRDVFNIQEKEIFVRPIDSDYWDGFSGQRSIVLDEFLIGDGPTKTARAKEYLALNSCARFSPNLASVDNPTVGIKGTNADPEIVLSISNTPYDVAPFIDSKALQRRRRYVITMERNPDCVEAGNDPHNVDFSAMTPQQIRQAAWLRFKILPSIRNEDQPDVNYPYQTYQEVVVALRESYAEHTRINTVLNENLGREVQRDLTPAQIIARITRQSLGVAFGDLDPENIQLESPDLCSSSTVTSPKPGGSLSKPEEEEGWRTVGPPRKNNGMKYTPIPRRAKDFRVHFNSPLTRPLNSPEITARNFYYSKLFRNLDRAGFENGAFTLARKSYVTYDEKGCMKDYMGYSNLVKWTEEETSNFYVHTHRCCSVEYSHNLLFDENRCEICLKVDSCMSCVGYFMTRERWLTEYKKMYMYYTRVKNIIFSTRSRTLGELCHVHNCCPEDPHYCIENKFYCPYNKDKHTLCEDCPDITEGFSIIGVGHYELLIADDTVPDMRLHANSLNLDYEEYKQAYKEAGRRFIDLDELEEEQNETVEMQRGTFFSYKCWKKMGIAAASLLAGVLLSSGFVLLYRGIRGAAGKKADKIDYHNFSIDSFETESRNGDIRSWRESNYQPSYKARGSAKGRGRGDKRNTDFETEKAIPYSLQIEVDGVPVNVIPIQAHYFISYYHGFKNCVDGKTKLIFSTGAKDYETVYKECYARILPEMDLICYNFYNLEFVSFPNLTRKFLSNKELATIIRVQAVLHRTYDVEHITAELCSNLTYSDGSERFELEKYLRYAASTRKGDCGRPIVAVNAHFNGRIIGMHVAGTVSKDLPVGGATVLTKEIIDDLTNFDQDKTSEEFDSEGLDATVAPNMVNFSIVPLGERLHQPNKTKIKESLLFGELGVEVKKAPAILSSRDLRSGGRNPIDVSLQEVIDIKHVKLDQNIVDQITLELQEHILRNMDIVFPHRMLTFEEACGGVPGLLKALNMKTSPGYPLVLTRMKQGKSDSVWFEEGELNSTPKFREQVNSKVLEITNYVPGEPIDHRFLGYLKDEIVPFRKIDACKTRMIYCNDLIALVAFRMFYGSTLINLMRAHKLTFALGQNPYSFDMDDIYCRLRQKGSRFLDGDYKSWDKTVNPQLVRAAYKIFCSLNGGLVTTSNVDEYLYNHEVHSPCQIEAYLIEFALTQVSGCFLTTIINCMVNDLNFRYCFYQLSPSLNYDENVDATFMGDDHIIAVSDKVSVTPKQIAETLACMGYTYTSAVKDQPLTEVWKRFEDCYYLGANVKSYQGRYVGALNKDTLWESLQWTHDSNRSLFYVIECFFECATMWGLDFFNHYTTVVNGALARLGEDPVRVPEFHSKAREVANRTGGTGCKFTWFAEGPADQKQARGITTLSVEQGVTGTLQSNKNRTSSLMKMAINEEPYSLETGYNTLVLRKELEWKASDANDTTIYSIDVPFGLIAEGNTNNIQNMSFQRMMYFSTDVDITFLINGNPFSQGALVAYWMPLCDSTTNVKFCNFRMNSHVLLFPNMNTTTSIHIPFLYRKNVMNTIAGELGLESLGTLFVKVLSPLVNPSPAPVTVSIFSSFSNTTFTIPRPISSTLAQFQAEGNSSSSEVNNYVVNTNSVVGTMPIESEVNSSASQSVGTDLGLSVPMDNPPLVSGSIPVHQVFSGMSKTIGVEPSVAFQFHPQAMFREPYQIAGGTDSLFESLVSRTGLIRRLTWKSGDIPGTVLTTINLNSVLGIADDIAFAQSRQIPGNIAILNYFDFWRADFEFELMAFKNSYQSGRLLATIAYGAPDFLPSERNVFKNNLLDYSKDNMTNSWIVPFNASTEYLRTWSGPNAYECLQNTSMGTMKIFVNNQLQGTAETVSDTVEMVLAVRIRNVQFVEFKNNPFIDANEAQATASFFSAEGPEGLNTLDTSLVPEESVVEKVTSTESEIQRAKPCKLDLGRKFEFIIRDVHEVARRPKQMYYDQVFLSTDNPATASILGVIQVVPKSNLGIYFRCWSGHMKYRIFCNASQVTSVFYYNDLPTNDTRGLKATLFARAGIPYSEAGYSFTAPTPCVPTEIMYNVALTQKYIDVSVPFNMHQNFCLNPIRFEGVGPYSFVGRVVVVFRNPDPTGLYRNDQIYSSLGDDGRYFAPVFVDSKFATPADAKLYGYGGFYKNYT